MSDADRTTEQDPLVEVLATVRSIDNRLPQLETNGEERSRETRPMWEQLLKVINTRFDAMEDRMERIEDQLQVLNKRDLEHGTEILKINRRIDRLQPDPTDAPTERVK